MRVFALTLSEVQRLLDLPAHITHWLEQVERPSDASGPALPTNAEAAQLLARLGVADIDRATTLAARPDPTTHPALWWVLDRAYHDIRATMGSPTGAGLAALPTATGPIGRHLYVWLFLAVLPHVRAYHAAMDIPDTISWASLAALGDEMTTSRLLCGISGLDSIWGLPLVFRGASYRLGRLAFDRQQPQPNPSGHALLEPGQSGLNTHVPSGGPLDAGACDDSFAQARAFFPRRFPEHIVAFGCHSWLMDGQLTTYLPATSNIIQFQRRFMHFTDDELADWAPLENLFHLRYDGPQVSPKVLNALPQQTTLQRAIVNHLRANGHWYNRTGWFPFNAQADA